MAYFHFNNKFERKRERERVKERKKREEERRKKKEKERKREILKTTGIVERSCALETDKPESEPVMLPLFQLYLIHSNT